MRTDLIPIREHTLHTIGRLLRGLQQHPICLDREIRGIAKEMTADMTPDQCLRFMDFYDPYTEQIQWPSADASGVSSPAETKKEQKTTAATPTPETIDSASGSKSK